MYLRVLDFNQGVAMIVTDLHGDWRLYCHYRDLFLEWHRQGRVHRLILCGDLIHREQSDQPDHSLAMLEDVMRLQNFYGPEVVVKLAGNHEIPHVYGMPLFRGGRQCTPAFEAALAKAGPTRRETIIAFLDSLPFYVRTAAGVLITHAGAHSASAVPAAREILEWFDHSALLERVEQEMERRGREQMLAEYQETYQVDYQRLAQLFLAVQTSEDPRFYHLLRVSLLQGDPHFSLLWKTLFSGNENELENYPQVVADFLRVWSPGASVEQKFLVTGHIVAEGGYRTVGTQQLRIASGAHAEPLTTARYLLLDCGQPVTVIDELVSGLRKAFLPTTNSTKEKTPGRNPNN